MAKAHIVWDMSGFEEIRYLPGVEARIEDEVDRAMVDAPWSAGYDGGVEDGGDRVRGYVYTYYYEAMLDNARNHTLARSISGGQGLALYTARSGRKSIVSLKQAVNWGGFYLEL